MAKEFQEINNKYTVSKLQSLAEMISLLTNNIYAYLKIDGYKGKIDIHYTVNENLKLSSIKLQSEQEDKQ